MWHSLTSRCATSWCDALFPTNEPGYTKSMLILIRTPLTCTASADFRSQDFWKSQTQWAGINGLLAKFACNVTNFSVPELTRLASAWLLSRDLLGYYLRTLLWIPAGWCRLGLFHLHYKASSRTGWWFPRILKAHNITAKSLQSVLKILWQLRW